MAHLDRDVIHVQLFSLKYFPFNYCLPCLHVRTVKGIYCRLSDQCQDRCTRNTKNQQIKSLRQVALSFQSNSFVFILFYIFTASSNMNIPKYPNPFFKNLFQKLRFEEKKNKSAGFKERKISGGSRNRISLKRKEN